MTYLLGTDEAGFGPNLGPLVISATAWRVADDKAGNDLYARLADTIVRRAADARGPRAAIADSKLLYSPGKGLRHLERGLFGALAILGRTSDRWQNIWTALDPQHTAIPPTAPWHDSYDLALPVDAPRAEIDAIRAAFDRTFDAAGVRLVDIQSRAIFPEQFNQLVRQHGSKGAALSHRTLDLLVEMMRPLGDEPIHVVCDKHGGRNRYADLLTQHFPEWLIEIYGEGREKSVYRFGPPQRRVEIAFQTKGESLLPTALASMASKYLRELAMLAFNAFWGERVEGLRPTAGYPVDARRFKSDIAAVQAELGIPDAILWREK